MWQYNLRCIAAASSRWWNIAAVGRGCGKVNVGNVGNQQYIVSIAMLKEDAARDNLWDVSLSAMHQALGGIYIFMENSKMWQLQRGRENDDVIHIS